MYKILKIKMYFEHVMIINRKRVIHPHSLPGNKLQAVEETCDRRIRIQGRRTTELGSSPLQRRGRHGASSSIFGNKKSLENLLIL